MSQDHGVFDNKLADFAMLPVVDVTAADASVGYAEEYIVRVGEGRDWTLFEYNLLRSLEDEGWVLLLIDISYGSWMKGASSHLGLCLCGHGCWQDDRFNF